MGKKSDEKDFPKWQPAHIALCITETDSQLCWVLVMMGHVLAASWVFWTGGRFPLTLLPQDLSKFPAHHCTAWILDDWRNRRNHGHTPRMRGTNGIRILWAVSGTMSVSRDSHVKDAFYFIGHKVHSQGSPEVHQASEQRHGGPSWFSFLHSAILSILVILELQNGYRNSRCELQAWPCPAKKRCCCLPRVWDCHRGKLCTRASSLTSTQTPLARTGAQAHALVDKGYRQTSVAPGHRNCRESDDKEKKDVS